LSFEINNVKREFDVYGHDEEIDEYNDPNFKK
jgi:hypothetical protein